MQCTPISKEIIARYYREIQDSKNPHKKLPDKTEIEKQMKEEILAKQNGLENMFKERQDDYKKMIQLKQKELKKREEIKAIKAARDHWIS